MQCPLTRSYNGNDCLRVMLRNFAPPLCPLRLLEGLFQGTWNVRFVRLLRMLAVSVRCIVCQKALEHGQGSSVTDWCAQVPITQKLVTEHKMFVMKHLEDMKTAKGVPTFSCQRRRWASNLVRWIALQWVRTNVSASELASLQPSLPSPGNSIFKAPKEIPY